MPPAAAEFFSVERRALEGSFEKLVKEKDMQGLDPFASQMGQTQLQRRSLFAQQSGVSEILADRVLPIREEARAGRASPRLHKSSGSYEKSQDWSRLRCEKSELLTQTMSSKNLALVPFYQYCRREVQQQRTIAFIHGPLDSYTPLVHQRC